MASRFEQTVTPLTQEKIGKVLGSFCMYGVRSVPHGKMSDLATNQYPARLSGQVEGVYMDAHTFWTPGGSDEDILLRGSVVLERDDKPGAISDYLIRHLDPIADTWEVERFIRPLPSVEPVASDNDIEEIDLFAGLEAQVAYWESVEESRETTRKLGLAVPSEGESQQLFALIESNLAALESAPPRYFKEAG